MKIKTKNLDEYNKQYYIKNKEHIDSYQKAYREANKAHIKQLQKDNTAKKKAQETEGNEEFQNYILDLLKKTQK